MAFDLGAMLAQVPGVSDPNTGKEQIEYVDLELILEDPNNFYSTEGIEELAANIQMMGLMDPLRIRPSQERIGCYSIVSGHRRRKALGLLQAEDPEKWGKAAVIIEENRGSAELQELRLIYANKSTRKYSSADLSDEAVRVEKLLYALQEQGYEFPGRMRDHVAEAVNASTTKLAKLKVIRENLDSIFASSYRLGELGESVAYALAQLPGGWQRLFYWAWAGNVKNLTEGTVRNAAKKFEKLADKKCPHAKHHTCWGNQARMQRIACLPHYDVGCSGCCYTCISLAHCKWNCTASDSKKKKLLAEEKIKKQEHKNTEAERIAPALEIIRGVYARWAHQLSFKGLTIREYIEACGSRLYENDEATFKKYGRAPSTASSENVKLPFSQNLYAADVAALVSAAEVLGCSIDWLLGRDVPGPGEQGKQETEGQVPDGGWGWADYNHEDPVAEGDYIVLMKWSAAGKVAVHKMVWDGCRFLYQDSDPEDIGATILYWMPAPEDIVW